MEGNGLSSLIDAVKTAFADFSVSNLSTVIVAGVAVAIPLVLGWFAFRFIARKISGALKKGRV